MTGWQTTAFVPLDGPWFAYFADVDADALWCLPLVGWLHQARGNEARTVAAVELWGRVEAAVDFAGAYVGARQPWMPMPPDDVVTAARLRVHAAEIRQLDGVPDRWVEEATR